MTGTSDPASEAGGQYTVPENIPVGEVHGNLSPDIIQITEDKLHRILLQHASSIEKKKSWVAPLGIAITICITLLTSNFSSLYTLSADTWKAVFVISFFLSILWLVKEVFVAFNSKKLEDLVELIKKQDK